MSRLRARCPDCRTLTAVAVGPEYQCHSCGREFLAGLVRVPRAWGDGGETMAEAAHLELPYPEASVIEADTLAEQNLLLACELPDRPIVLGGCCCSHVGAIEALSAGEECLAVVWLDAHGDLNTPQSSPSRERVGDAVADGDRRRRRAAAQRRPRRRPQSRPARGRVHRVGGRPDGRRRDRACARRRRRRLRRARLRLVRPGRAGRVHARAGRASARRGRGAAPRSLVSRVRVAGLGFTGLVRDDANEAKLARLAAALGL